MQLQESGEMYLETIHVLSKKLPCVRSVDVGEYMGYSKPSVSRAIGLLKNGGYVKVDDNGHLHLTDEGLKVANKIYDRHNLLKSLLLKVGVAEDIAAEDACRIEHVISDETYLALKKYFEEIK
jgi:Mn-dependent DtxR family transcriptional regulator